MPSSILVSLVGKKFALNSRILRLLYLSPSHVYLLIQVLGEAEVNIFSSCQLKLDVLNSSDLESFLLGVAITVHGNTCPSLGCPIQIETTNFA
jgi:hypothetical protein